LLLSGKTERDTPSLRDIETPTGLERNRKNFKKKGNGGGGKGETSRRNVGDRNVCVARHRGELNRKKNHTRRLCEGTLRG